MKNGWTGGQYSIYRGLFGTYLLVHYIRLVPWGQELFSSAGLLPSPSLSPLARLFPNVLTISDSPFFVQLLLILAACLALLFAIGLWDRTAAVLLWYLGACLLGRNPLIANPALPYVGLLLLAHAFLPENPFGSLSSRLRKATTDDWRMPPSIYMVVWILMSVGYTYSGLMKIASPSWIDGSALARILSNPLARPGLFRNLVLALPPGFLKCATWAALAMEVTFAPIVLFRRLRLCIWTAMLSLHLGLFLLISFPDLTAGMVFLHLFTLDPAWFRLRRRFPANI
jgi:vitamin K-dependent gamma-carboxylase-like protein